MDFAFGRKGVLIPVAAEKSSKSSSMAESKSNSQSARRRRGEGVSKSGCLRGGVADGCRQDERDGANGGSRIS